MCFVRTRHANTDLTDTLNDKEIVQLIFTAQEVSEDAAEAADPEAAEALVLAANEVHPGNHHRLFCQEINSFPPTPSILLLFSPRTFSSWLIYRKASTAAAAVTMSW